MTKSGQKYCTIFSLNFGAPVTLVMQIKMHLNETHSKVCLGKNLSDAFPIQNGLIQGYALSA
jgi:hypothetical protein